MTIKLICIRTTKRRITKKSKIFDKDLKAKWELKTSKNPRKTEKCTKKLYFSVFFFIFLKIPVGIRKKDPRIRRVISN